MIKEITVTNHRGESINLELKRPDLSGFIVKRVDGLGPAKANVNVTDVATLDGSLYNSARLDSRNIVFNLEFYQTSKESIEDIRLKSYRYFPIKQNVKIVIKTDNRTLETNGYVESNEPDIFSENEGCSISILCPDPFFYSIDVNETRFSGVRAEFEFPFENESTTEPLLEMGTILSKSEENVYYAGDLEIGFTMTIHAVGEVSKLSIYNLTNGERMNIDTSKIAAITNDSNVDIIPGDTITINTMRRNKGVTLLRNGVKYNILNCLDRGTKWLTLTKGDNVFVYTAEEGSSNLQFAIINRIAYEGV